jgi:hypothetical protein
MLELAEAYKALDGLSIRRIASSEMSAKWVSLPHIKMSAK